jgi:hypothetical protein
MIKNRKIFILPLVAVMFVLNACKKNEIIPPPGSSTPVFTAIGSFGNEEIDLRAGDNGVVMTTESTLLNGVDFFKGNLGNQNFTIEIGVFGGDVDFQNSQVPEFSNQSAISFAYLAQQPPLFSIRKDSLPNSASIIKVEWEVNGVMQTLLDNLEIRDPGKYQVCGHVTFNDNTVETVCNEVIVGFKPNVAFELQFVLGQNHNLMAWIDPQIGIVQSVKWFQDGVLVSDLNQLNKHLEDESHLIQAEVLFTNGVRSVRSVVVDADLTGKNIYDFSKFYNIFPSEWDFKAKVKVMKNNIAYYSYLTPNSSNQIVVDDVKYHGLNPQGKEVYILKGHLNVNVKSNISSTVIPLDLNFAFGIALK